MEKTSTAILTTLGIIFIFLILIAGGLYLAMQNGWAPLSRYSSSAKTPPAQIEGENTPFTLSAAQMQALIGVGIDPASLPDSITPTQRTCFVSNLGEEKFNEVQGGVVPSALDMAKIKGCL